VSGKQLGNDLSQQASVEADNGGETLPGICGRGRAQAADELSDAEQSGLAEGAFAGKGLIAQLLKRIEGGDPLGAYLETKSEELLGELCLAPLVLAKPRSLVFGELVCDHDRLLDDAASYRVTGTVRAWF
jgi:hypothetical protein